MGEARKAIEFGAVPVRKARGRHSIAKGESVPKSKFPNDAENHCGASCWATNKKDKNKSKSDCHSLVVPRKVGKHLKAMKKYYRKHFHKLNNEGKFNKMKTIIRFYPRSKHKKGRQYKVKLGSSNYYPKTALFYFHRIDDPEIGYEVCIGTASFILGVSHAYLQKVQKQLWDQRNQFVPQLPKGNYAQRKSSWIAAFHRYLLKYYVLLPRHYASRGETPESLKHMRVVIEKDNARGVKTLKDLYNDFILTWNQPAHASMMEHQAYVDWEKKGRVGPRPPLKLKLPVVPKFSTFKHHFYSVLNIKLGPAKKDVCGRCLGLSDLITKYGRHTKKGRDVAADLEYHKKRAKFRRLSINGWKQISRDSWAPRVLRDRQIIAEAFKEIIPTLADD